MKSIGRVGRYIFVMILVSVAVGTALMWNEFRGDRRASEAVMPVAPSSALQNHESSKNHVGEESSGKIASVRLASQRGNESVDPVSMADQLQRDFKLTSPYEKSLSEQILRLNEGRGGVYVATVLAIVRGNVEEVEWFLGSGVSPNAEVHIGYGSSGTYADMSLMDFALESNQVLSAAALIKAGAAINTPSGDGSLPLERAAIRDETKMVALLLDSGAEIDKVDSTGMTPLGRAITWGQYDTTELLLARGASVTAALGSGRVLPQNFANPRSEEYARVRDLMIANGAVMPSGSATRP